MKKSNLRGSAEYFTTLVSAELKGAIISRKYTLQEVAKAQGYSVAGFNRWLNGKVPLPLHVHYSVSTFLGMIPAEIVHRGTQSAPK